jgi:hypothetical protein
VSALNLDTPRSLEETGVSADNIEQLMVKTLYGRGSDRARACRSPPLPFNLLEPLIERVRAERLVEVRGAHGSGAASYRYALTDAGRDRGRQYLDASAYVGPVPVPLAQYVRYMAALSASRGYLDRDRLREGFLAPDRR